MQASPHQEELAEEMRMLPTANLVANIGKAQTNEKVTAFFSNLKRMITEGAGAIALAATIELAKRVSISGSETALEQENIRLRARLLELEERLAKLENSASQQAAKTPAKTTRNCSGTGEGNMPPPPPEPEKQSIVHGQPLEKRAKSPRSRIKKETAQTRLTSTPSSR
ncbi:hypothetical protein QLX08_005919 [Tetragonisca angustula]|uniref:Uncharacterized protein n=1 Tax=Tetragonisca angustula TaxID=166442 RepID=A0AAW0ZWU7_9HYME